jgi:CRISPR type III-B/RAMP module RAMP protein Cmr6
MNYYLPNATAQLLTEGQLKKCKNLGLILDKYAPETAIQKSEGKSIWLKEIASGSHLDPRLTESIYKRWLNMIEAVGALRFSAVTDWRMAVGLGGESVLETDLTLHHLYGIPYIPGSALKGLTRAYVTGEVYPSKDIEHDNETVKHIFGSQDRAGTVIFFDAMPVDGKATFALDIMNSHYPNYYGEKKPPTNDQNPNPVTFLTVTSTTFMFALATRDPRYIDDVNKAKDWLQKALEKYGVGGKTSAGYGYFKIQEEREQASVGQQSSQTTVTSTAGQPSIPKEYVRPPIPNFRVGQDITGSVVPATDDLRRRTPSDTKAFLRYQSFALKDVVIIVSAEEAQNWKPGETRICQFVREEEVEGCTVLVCQPRLSKKKKE